jgi:parvulin-like peptidyl-prolyl isomerase
MLAAAVAMSAAVLDRVAVVVGNTAITETEVLREVRLTELLNGEPLDTGPQQRKAAAERLVDQQLIRNEMATGTYPMPADDEAEDMLRDFRQQRFTTEAQYRAALAKYGVTEPDLKEHLLWVLAAIRFTVLRFQPNAPDGQSANRAKPGAPAPAGSDVDQQLDSWLKEQRRNTRVKFKQAAFQ